MLGVGVQYKLISGISISPDYLVGETTMFSDTFDQTLCFHTNLENVPGDGIYGCHWIADLVSENHVTPYAIPR